ncbi:MULTISPECIES: hypothetical protein [unclassified Halomonas]|uniref:hypothetical protein n=1 Tax=unclassified Halomonas TaxID=2609666 RepID=UPI002885B497|nr:MULTISPECIES: hypothetical protein [unclassified Halomonas]MDT0500113.1 hypothetical protein [Halomonas sp. PAR7]MDT0512517.1 hypothetical protein [Halomonas sp. LES1]MDT0591151.1 hypothetical protein [Halomonas sp. PAR8]
MNCKSLGAFVIAALATAPAMAQDYLEDAEKSLEHREQALKAYEEECRSIYHQTWYVFNFRFDVEGTEEEARELFLSENYVDGSVMDSKGLENLVNTAYVNLADIQPNTASSDWLSREVALNSYAFCMGLIES